jgi:2-oxoisovalerate dehydrogenase E1 component beta subunit
MTQIIERPPFHDDDADGAAHTPDVHHRARRRALTMAQAINRASARRDGGRRPGAGIRRGRRQARRRVPGYRGAGRNIRRAKVFRHPAGGVGIVGIAIGLAIRGFVPVPEIQFDGFAARRSIRWSATWRSTGCAPAATSTCR